jgi:hypothetical protein
LIDLRPRQVPALVQAPPKRPLYRRPWFWGTLAAVTAGVGASIGAAVALTRGDPAPPEPTSTRQIGVDHVTFPLIP